MVELSGGKEGSEEGSFVVRYSTGIEVAIQTGELKGVGFPRRVGCRSRNNVVMAVKENVFAVFGGWRGGEAGVDDRVARTALGGCRKEFGSGAKPAEEGLEVGCAAAGFGSVGGGGRVRD